MATARRRCPFLVVCLLMGAAAAYISFPQAAAAQTTDLQHQVNRAERRLQDMVKDLRERENGYTRRDWCRDLERIQQDMKEDLAEAPADDPGRNAAEQIVGGAGRILGLKEEGEIRGRFTAARHVEELLELIDRAQGEW